MLDKEFSQSILQTIHHIPYGHVASYGQIAKLAGFTGYARHVGYLLKRLPKGSSIPWHRVVNSQGKISLEGEAAHMQHQLLLAEGVVFKANGRVDLKQSAWII